MKKFLLMLVVLPMMLTGCHEQKYKPIEDSFKKYVATNFDDPNALKEIVQISPVDTFNTEDYKRICCDYLNTYKESEQTADSLFKEVTDRIKKYPKGSIARMPNSDEFKMLFLTSADLTKQQIELAEQDDFIAPSMPDVIASQNDTTIISYSIKYRYETSYGLKIDSVFANSNVSNSQILICKELSPECFGEDNAKFMHNFTKSCISWKVLIDLNCKKIENSKQMIEWLDNLGK